MELANWRRQPCQNRDDGYLEAVVTLEAESCMTETENHKTRARDRTTGTGQDLSRVKERGP